MAQLNEIKEQRIVVQSVGEFANSLQQIAAARMAKLRKTVESSQRFVEEATIILRELQLERRKMYQHELQKAGLVPKPKKHKKQKDESEAKPKRSAVIVISTDQGLCGSYNTEIFTKLEAVVAQHLTSEWFVIGSKAQEYFKKFSKKNSLRYYPVHLKEDPSIDQLKPLIGMFYYYDTIHLIYSHYINTAKREVVLIELAIPAIESEESEKEAVEGKFIFEPSVDELIRSMSARLRYALFRQQILDAKLALYAAQMMAMKTAADNSVDLLKDLQMQYNKARRKQIDKKIQEVQAGRSLWA